LVLAGAALVWLVLLCPLIFGVVSLIAWGRFHLDYLLPAELCFLAFAGGLMLVWGSLRLHRHRALLGGALLAAVVALIGSQGLAVATGMATGARAAEGWPLIMVLVLLGAYVLALVVMGVMGIMLSRDVGSSLASA